MGTGGLKKGISGGALVIIAAIVWWIGRGDAKVGAVKEVGQALQKKLAAQGPISIEADEAKEVKEMLSRLDKYSPLHARFAAASLAIAQNELQKALDETLALEEELQKNQDDSLLHAFNLVRIAFLYQSLGQKENEKKAWLAIEAQAGSKNFAQVAEDFSCEGSGLRDYIRYRLSQL